MRKKLCVSIILILIIFNLIGCKTNTVGTSIEGQWGLEVISCGDEGILVVGKAFNNYDEFDGQKEDMRAKFKKDGTFQIAGSEEQLEGDYKKEVELNTTDTIAITMNFDNGTKTMGVFGTQQYQDGEKVNSLTFAIDEKIYSFIKLEED